MKKMMDEPDHGMRTVCVGHRFHSVCMEMPQEDFKQGRDMIQFVFFFFKGKFIPVQNLQLGNLKNRQYKFPLL